MVLSESRVCSDKEYAYKKYYFHSSLRIMSVVVGFPLPILMDLQDLLLHVVVFHLPIP